MKIKIVSDGTPQGTKLLDASTGKQLALPIEMVSWYIECSGVGKVTLTVPFVEVDLVGELEKVTRHTMTSGTDRRPPR